MMEHLAKISKVFDAPEAIADIKYRDTVGPPSFIGQKHAAIDHRSVEFAGEFGRHPRQRESAFGRTQ